MIKYLYISVLVALSNIHILQAQTETNDMVFWGMFEEGLHTNMSQVQSYATQFGKKPGIVMWYTSWQTNNGHAFPIADCQRVSDAGYIPHIVWEPWMGLDEILSGKWDADLTKYGQDIAKYGKPVMLRWGHEFNGDWYPWSYINNKPEPASKWVQAYKHVHDLVVAAGGSNALWLWSPNNGNGSKNPQDITLYYPGDDYVDWIAMDGYNWGTSQSWSSWTSFDGVFGAIYNKLRSNYPNKPIMLGEFGCASAGGDKAAWINDFFKQIKNKYTHIKAFIWFNINKETDWRFNSTSLSTEAFKQGLADPVISEDVQELLALTFKPGKIAGKNLIIPGETGTTYSVSGASKTWTYKWSVTGNAKIIVETNKDSVIVDWGCSKDTLRCLVANQNRTVEVMMVPDLSDLDITGKLFVNSNEQNFELSVPYSDNSTYQWILPEGVTLNGSSDTNVIKVNWGPKTDTIKLILTNACATMDAQKTIYLTGRYPYPNPSQPHVLPGTIEATDFDYGGEMIAYHDSDPQNSGSGPRSDEGIDTELNDGGSNIGWINSGEWITYSVKVTQPGDYFTELRVASQSGGGALSISLNDIEKISNFSIGASGSWSTFKSVYPGKITISENDTLLKYTIINGGFNIGRLIFWDIDNTAPSKPENLSGVPTKNSIALKWNHSTDNQKMFGYKIFVNGTQKTIVSDSTYNLTALISGTAYHIGIIAVDIQGNESDTLSGHFITLSTSIESSEQLNLTTYPNPVKDYLYVKANIFLKNASVNICSPDGKIIENFKINKPTQYIKIDASALKTGIYIINIHSQKYNTNTTFVKF